MSIKRSFISILHRPLFRVICQNSHWQLISSVLLPSAPYRRPKAMPRPDGYKELCSCQNFPASKTYCPHKPPLNCEKWRRATDFILRSDAQEKDHHLWASQHSTPAAQNPHQEIAAQGLVAPPRIKPTTKLNLLKAQFLADHLQPVNNMDDVPAPDPTCSGTPHKMFKSYIPTLLLFSDCLISIYEHKLPVD